MQYYPVLYLERHLSTPRATVSRKVAAPAELASSVAERGWQGEATVTRSCEARPHPAPPSAWTHRSLYTGLANTASNSPLA